MRAVCGGSLPPITMKLRGGVTAFTTPCTCAAICAASLWLALTTLVFPGKPWMNGSG